MDHPDMDPGVGHHGLVPINNHILLLYLPVQKYNLVEPLLELNPCLLIRLHTELGDDFGQGHLHLRHCKALACRQHECQKQCALYYRLLQDHMS